MRSVGPLALLALLVLVVAWLALRGGASPSTTQGRAPRGAPAGARPWSPELEPGAPPNAPDATPDPAAGARSSAAARETGERPSENEEEHYTFVGRLVLPDRTEVTATDVRAVLTSRSGEVRRYAADSSEHVAFDRTTRELYTLEVRAPGYTHRPETFDLTEAQISGRGPTRIFSERVTLWPSTWIPVVVRTRDGRPYSVLAEELGWEPRRLFVHAFRVGTSLERPAEGAPVPPEENELARFRPPPGYQTVELPGGVAGSLELLSPPPLWVGLWVHGVFFEARMLRPGDTEVAFEVDLEVLGRGMATVNAQLVDRDSGDPVVAALATLKANTSAHRRADLSDVAPDGEGRLVFERVIPGRHELTVTRGHNLVQRILDVAPAEEHDLGRIELGAGPGLLLRVVDAAGQPAPAWIEIAPYVRGKWVEELYPPNLHRMTGAGGTFELPVPDRPSIVRVRPTQLGRSYRQHAWVGSLNYLIDPEQLPGELVILAQDPVEVAVQPLTAWRPEHRLTVEDDLGLVVDIANGPTPEQLQLDLVPGTYRIRRWDGAEEVGSVDVSVDGDTAEVRCP